MGYRLRRLAPLPLVAVLLSLCPRLVSAAPPVSIQWFDNAANVLRTVGPGAANALPVNDQDRDRDYSVFYNLFNGVVLNAGTTFQQPDAKDISQFSRASLWVTWGSAPADTDSTRFALRVYGKISANSGNMYLWTPQDGIVSADTCYTDGQVPADSTSTGRCLQPISYWVTRKPVPVPVVSGGLTNLYVGAGMTGSPNPRVRIRRVPGWAFRTCGSNGVLIPLIGCPFKFIVVEIINCTLGCNLTNVACDVWPRVF